MKLVSGIVDSGFFAQSALSAEVATKDSLGRNISETYLTGVDLTPYQLTADMTAYQSAGDYLTTADSANFYTTANESGFITGVPDTYLQNTDLATADGKVTAISGIPLSAGVVPGYNETVLWDGNGTGAGYNTEISLSSPTSAFETVKFYWAGENGRNVATYRISEFAITDARELPLDGLWQRYSDGKFNFVGCMVSANSDLTKYKISHTYRYNLSTSVIDINRDQSNFAYIHRVIGINRKAQ